ncbi:kinase-like domain-containing protein [Favolaschia claudopus]|uniref:Kinase-like domain-containing protein n=1 Tax=Favolaschia claudopus TaxID=2862362 RepID=A0AAW0BSY5_9AGAR
MTVDKPFRFDRAQAFAQKWPQCTVCGITRRNMVPASSDSIQTCGSTACLKAAVGEGPAPLGPSLAANAAFESNQRRVQLMRERLKKIWAPGKRCSSLQSHENGGGAPGEPKIWICWQVRLSSQPKAIAASLGYHAKGWAVSLFMPDIKAEIVKVINTEWCSLKGTPLLPEEVSFRWHGNRILDPGTHTLVLSEFYAHYSSPTNASEYLHNVPAQWKNFEKTRATKRFICLEIYVMLQMYEQRVEQSVSQASVAGTKRARTISSAVVGPGSKQLPPISTWNGASRARTPIAAAAKFSQITFKKFQITTAKEDGRTLLIEDEILRGKISDQPFASGRMKHAHDLLLSNGDQLVAKRFYQLSEDAQFVSISENEAEIQAELTRLAMGQWFLQNFYHFCKDRDALDRVEPLLAFADAFLAQEVDLPSVASGVEQIEADGTGLTWLVERRRPTTVIKYSGTLVHTSARRDLASLTISAFAHYVFGDSQRRMVFADLQGTPTRVRGGDGIVLFDLMTRTVPGDSGVGDFGSEGINSFVQDHECGTVCSALELDQLYPLDAPPETQEADEDQLDSDN